MNKQIELQLIDGLFESSEALDVLTSLYRNKIQFHEMKNFKSIEQTGHENSKALQRIRHLKENLSHLNEFLRTQNQTNPEIQIKAQIQIQLK